MNNWKEFFAKYLIQSGFFIIDQSTREGDSDIEIFLSNDNLDKTSIKTGYLPDSELIFCEIINPDTLGFNKYQEQEYYYRFDFTPGESYGPPGLEFNEINRNALYDFLKNGLKGKEEQYYQGDRLIKSIIYQNYQEGESSDLGQTIWFEKGSLMKRLRRLFSNDKSDFDIKVIKLESIFKGLEI